MALEKILVPEGITIIEEKALDYEVMKRIDQSVREAIAKNDPQILITSVLTEISIIAH